MFIHGEDLLPCPPIRPMVMDRRWKPNVELAPNCPRCDSSNTKFCYYNNYSLTQPRYFCKGCRRYWTKGGSLRNVPVGGGCRKNRRGKSVRISTDRASTGSSNYRSTLPSIECSGFPSADPIVNSCRWDGNVMVSNTNPPRSDASTIDLALVYAKFLNHRPHSDSELVMPDLPREFEAPFDLSSISDPPNHDPNVRFSQEQCIVGCHGTSDPSPVTQLSEGHQVFLGEFDLNYKQQERISQFTSLDTINYGLQVLPVEEVVVQDMLWSNSPVVGSSFTWQATQLKAFDPVLAEDHQSILHSNASNGNWSSFDLPNYEAFSRS